MARLVYIPDPASASDSSGSFTVRFPTSSTGSATVQIVGTLRVYADDFGSITIPGVASGSHTWVRGGPREGAAPGDSDWSVFPFGPTSVPSGGSVTATWEYHNNGSWGRLDYELDIFEYRPDPGPSSTPEPEPSSSSRGDSTSGGGSSGGGGGGSSGDTSSGYSPSGASSLSSVGSLSSAVSSSSTTWTESSSVSSSLWGSESSPEGSSSSSEISPEGSSSGQSAESSSLFSSSQSSSIFSSSSSSLWDSSSSSSSSVSSSSGCQCLSKGDGHYSESTLATSGGKLVVNCFGCLELWTECGWGICDIDEWKTSGQDS